MSQYKQLQCHPCIPSQGRIIPGFSSAILSTVRVFRDSYEVLECREVCGRLQATSPESCREAPLPFHYTVENRKLNLFKNKQALARSSFSCSTISQHLHARSAASTESQPHIPRDLYWENNGIFSTNYLTAEVITCL